MVAPTLTRKLCCQFSLRKEAVTVENVTLIGIDLGKHSFHLQGRTDMGKQCFAGR